MEAKFKALLPDRLMALRRRRLGDPNAVAPLVRICFMWAPGAWYFATVLSETTTKGWWNVQWDDKTKHQILLSRNSVGQAHRTFWFILEDQEDDYKCALSTSSVRARP